MRFRGILCGCYAPPKTIGGVEAGCVPQDLQADQVVTTGPAKPEHAVTADACAIAVIAEDSIGETLQRGSRKSRVGSGLDYLYMVPHGSSSLSSRALVGGVEYDSFFVNPLAEGSHEDGSPIPYAGAVIKAGDAGLHNPLAEEFSDYTSPPDSPAYAKIHAFSRPCTSGVCCGDTTAPAAPGTPPRGSNTVEADRDFLSDHFHHNRQENEYRFAPASAHRHEQQCLRQEGRGEGDTAEAREQEEQDPVLAREEEQLTSPAAGSCQPSEVSQLTPSWLSSPLLSHLKEGPTVQSGASGISELRPESPDGKSSNLQAIQEPLAPCTPPLAAREVGAPASPALESRALHSTLASQAGREREDELGAAHQQQRQEEPRGMEQVPLARLSLDPLCEPGPEDTLRCGQSLAEGGHVDAGVEGAEEQAAGPCDSLLPLSSPLATAPQSAVLPLQEPGEAPQSMELPLEEADGACLEGPLPLPNSRGCIEAGSCGCGAVTAASSRCSSIGGAVEAPVMIPSLSSSIEGAVDSVPRVSPTDPGCSISALAMTRLLIRQLGLLPHPVVDSDCMAVPHSDDAAAPSRRAPLPPSPFATACRSAMAALHPDSVDTGNGSSPCVVAGGGGDGLKPADTVAPADGGQAAAEDSPSEHDGDTVVCALALCNSHAGCRKGSDAQSNATDMWLESDDCSSVASTRANSTVGGVSMRTMQNWLEPQGWKPLRERFCAGEVVV